MESNNYRIFDLNDKDCFEFVASFNSRQKFMKSFTENFDFIVGYHGTNISESEREDILINGMKRPDTAFMKHKAMQRFMLPEDDFSLAERIKITIDKFFEEEKMITLGELNFSTDRELVNEYYHYLLFGPESLLPLASILKNEFYFSFRERMMEHGNHTVIICRIPVSEVGKIWIRCVYDYVNGNHPECSIVIKKDVPAVHIIELEIVERPADHTGFLYM